jgi:CheY-like chemotaxis protein
VTQRANPEGLEYRYLRASMTGDFYNSAPLDLNKLDTSAPTVLLLEQHAGLLENHPMSLFQAGHFDIQRVSTFEQLLTSALSNQHPVTGECQFEMLLLDEDMLQGDGIQILLVLKAMPETRNIPVLVVGRAAELGNSAHWLRSGATGVLSR